MPVKVRTQLVPRVAQGDIIRDVEFIEYVYEDNGNLEVSKILFPLVIVLTQDCDLEQDYKFRWSRKQKPNQDKWLLSTIVAPLYNVEHVYSGEHLAEVGLQMGSITKKRTQGSNLRNNETPRYHFVEFPSNVPISPSVIDFKHYFSIGVPELKKQKKQKFVCKLSDLYREDVSQRFASYLSRIGLP